MIAENLKKESVEKRLLALVTHDWTAEAEEYINTQKNEGFANPATGEFVRHFLVLISLSCLVLPNSGRTIRGNG